MDGYHPVFALAQAPGAAIGSTGGTAENRIAPQEIPSGLRSGLHTGAHA